MKRLHTLPTDNVILECLANDTLGRNEDVARFCSIIDSFHECTVVAIDGAWGSGKTFFVKQSKMLLDSFCAKSSLKKAEAASLYNMKSMDNSPYKNLNINQNHSTVYYDAWENDNNSDPILSIIYAVIRTKQVSLHLKNDTSVYDILKSLADCLTGRNISALSDAIKGTDIMDDIKHQDTIKDLMLKFINKAIGTKNKRLVIFIDELDRCKPTFAVSLLERVKHFFTDDRLTFVFSINQDQLQHTIRGFYGSGMNGSKYLEKLFDISFPLPEVNMQQYISHLGFQNKSYTYDKINLAVIRYFQFGLRDTAKFLQYNKLTTYDLVHDNNSRVIYENALRFCLTYITPIMIGLRIHDASKYNAFVRGNYSKPLIDILTASSTMFRQNDFLLDYKEVFKGAVDKLTPSERENVVEVDLVERLTSVYTTIFQRDYSNHDEIRIGDMIFDEYLRSKLLGLISPLSRYANINTIVI